MNRNMSARGLPVYAVGLPVAAFLAGSPASAAEGQPDNWQLGFQQAASPIASQIDTVHLFMQIIITGIVVFVVALLMWVMVRYNEKANPAPSETEHNTILEVVWTVVPVIILVIIAIPSTQLLYAQYDFPKADLTVKATGQQWYWDYEYPDHGPLSFSSTIVDDNELKPGQPRLLTVDNEMVVPVNKAVHVLTTASTVVHNWTVPSLGSKVDAIPGRIARTWFRAEKTGVYYGQCMELCGINHFRMPIAVRAVTEEEFAAWVEKMKKKAPVREPAHAGATGTTIAFSTD